MPTTTRRRSGGDIWSTTIRMPHELAVRLKLAAWNNHQTVNEVVNNLVTAHLAELAEEKTK